MEYLRAHPEVRDVVVSGGDVANMPWARLEDFLTRLLEIDNIRDIRLATKALMGLPQHWLQPEVVDGVARVARTAQERGRLAGDPHARQPRELGDPAGGQGGEDDARGRGARRAQPGRAHERRQRRRAQPARPLLRPPRRRPGHAVLLLHVRHDPERRALAGLRRRGAAAPAPDDGLPAGLRDAAHRLRRPVRRQALGAPARGVRPREGHLVLDEELPHLDRGRPTTRRPRATTSTTTRSTRSRSPARPGGASSASTLTSGEPSSLTLV